MGSNRTGVFVLEDHPQTLAQLEAAVASDARLSLAGSARTLAEARLWWADHPAPDAALIDLGLPDGHGLELIREVTAQHPQTAVLVITVFGDEKNVISAIEAGATGYLLKERDASYIAESICTVVAGGSPISPSIARHLLRRFRPDQEQPAEQKETGHTASGASAFALTERETEVLRFVVKGFTYREIAEKLSVSVHTVTSHIQHIYRKMSVSSRGEAVFEAIQMGLVDVGPEG